MQRGTIEEIEIKAKIIEVYTTFDAHCMSGITCNTF